MDQCTHEVRKQYWKNIISRCQQRPEGQSARQWMAENGICVQSYYRWQRTIQKESAVAGDTRLPVMEKASEISFVEVPVPAKPDICRYGRTVSDENISAPMVVIRTAACAIEISNNISGNLLAAILQEVAHA